MKFDPLPISSTQVRSFIGEGKPIGDLLPSCVAKYIEESKLYKDAKGEE